MSLVLRATILEGGIKPIEYMTLRSTEYIVVWVLLRPTRASESAVRWDVRFFVPIPSSETQRQSVRSGEKARGKF